MKTLSLRQEGAKKSSAISLEEDSSPLVLIDPPPPSFDPPPPSSESPDDLFPSAPVDPDIPLWLQTTSRKAMHWLHSRLHSREQIAIWVVALDIHCVAVGSACVAQGGISRVEIALPDLIMKARSMGAAGIVLVQNRPGSARNQMPIDPNVTIEVALICDLLGMPLIDHIYRNSRGEVTFVRERGALNALPELVRSIRAYRETMAREVVDKGLLDDDYYDKKAETREAAAAAGAGDPGVEVHQRRRA